MKKRTILLTVLMVINIGLFSGCIGERNPFYINTIIQNNWESDQVYIEVIWDDLDGSRSYSKTILSYGNSSLGNRTVQKILTEYNFQMIVGIYETDSLQDSQGYYIQDHALQLHKSNWTLTSQDYYANFTIFINETGIISVTKL